MGDRRSPDATRPSRRGAGAGGRERETAVGPGDAAPAGGRRTAPSSRGAARRRVREAGRGRGDDAPHLLRSRRVLEDLFGPARERRFAVRYWDAGIERPADARDFTLLLTWPGALRRALLPPTERSLGAAYVRGDVDVEGDLEAAVRTIAPAAGRLWSPRRAARLAPSLLALPRRPADAGASGETRGAPARSGPRHSRDRDARAVRYHYDLGNDFFRLWLDPWMQYSCGFFPDAGASLREAQEAKLELVCDALRLEPGDRLLDIGCGWGGLIHYAAERRGVEGLGITLSEPQARAARRRLAAAGLDDRCRIRVCDYRDPLGDGPFEKAVSVGMVEHVGHRRMGEYFRHVHRNLEPGGLFLNQGIVTLDDAPPWRRRLRERLTAPWNSFIERYVFPDGELVTTAERVGPAETAGLELLAVRSLRQHYAETLRRWIGRLEDRRREAVADVGRPTYRVWRLYLAGSAHGFEAGEMGVIQELYRKPDLTRPPGTVG